jgi:DNA-binding response OmpR family regulator
METMENLNRKTILVVEDDEHTNLLLVENLKHEGYSVVPVFDGEEALRAAARHKPDLIVLDLMLPKLNGWEVCRRLREVGSPARDVPIFIVSVVSQDARSLQQTLQRLTIVSKPFNVRDLLSEIRRAVDGAPGPADV